MCKKKKFIKILYVNGGSMDHGGITSYMMNFYRQFDFQSMRIDFVTQGENRDLYIDEIRKNGGNIYKIPNKSVSIVRNIRGLYKIMKNGNYNIVHAHADAGNSVILAVAKISGIPIRISHSHSTNFYTESKLKRYINNIQRKMIKRYATNFWGCSDAACKWLYTEQIPYHVINNAIDISKYKFDANKRKIVRKKLNIGDNVLAICQVGHLNYIKNPQYTIHILNTFKDCNPNKEFRMFFIGDGEERNKIESLVEESDLSENVVFLGQRNDVPLILQGMDIFLLPSKFEGFPVSLVESQTAGLFSLVSSNITHDVCINKELVKYISIDEKSINNWVIELKKEHKLNRENAYLYVEEAGFNIVTEAKKVQKMYEKLSTKY